MIACGGMHPHDSGVVTHLSLYSAAAGGPWSSGL